MILYFSQTHCQTTNCSRGDICLMLRDIDHRAHLSGKCKLVLGDSPVCAHTTIMLTGARNRLRQGTKETRGRDLSCPTCNV